MRISILLLQGTRDNLAKIAQLEGVAAEIGASDTLLVTPEVHHSFHVPARSGTMDAQVLEVILDGAASWMRDMAAVT